MTLPTLFEICNPPDKLARSLSLIRGGESALDKTKNALLSLAMASLAIRRGQRVWRNDEEQDKYLHHYAKRGTFDLLFPEQPPKEPVTRNILLTFAGGLNDPSEGAVFYEGLEKHFKDNEKVLVFAEKIFQRRKDRPTILGIDGTDLLVFTASLCIKQDSLNLWRFYGGDASGAGGDANGVSFGIHSTLFDCETDEGPIDDAYEKDRLYKVSYGKKNTERALNQLRPALNEIGQLFAPCNIEKLLPEEYREEYKDYILNSTVSILDTIAYLFKSDAYKAEEECRIIRIASIDDVRKKSDDYLILQGHLRPKAKTEIIYKNKAFPPIITLGPKFDHVNPLNSQVGAINRIQQSLPPPDRVTVKLSDTKYR